jgi:hypothetical protein
MIEEMASASQQAVESFTDHNSGKIFRQRDGFSLQFRQASDVHAISLMCPSVIIRRGDFLQRLEDFSRAGGRA